MYKFSIIASLLTSMVFAIGVRAQLSWKLLHTDLGDKTQYDFYSISCAGNNCTAGLTTISWRNGDWIQSFYRSTDGGQTWFSQIPDLEYPKGFTEKRFLKIQQLDSLNIIALNDECIVRTSDAGSTWVLQNNPTSFSLVDMHFSDASTGILVTTGGRTNKNIFLTSDGGQHWDSVLFKQLSLSTCHSYGNGKYRVVKYNTGEVFTTTDYFATVDSTGPAIDTIADSHWRGKVIAECAFGTGDTIIGYGTAAREGIDYDTIPGYNMLIRTTNGGKKWEKPHIFFSGHYGGIWYSTAPTRDTVIAIGNSRNKIFRSFDRGATWTMDSLVLDTSYTAVGTQGLAMTTDGSVIASYALNSFRPGPSILTRGTWKQNSSVVRKLIPAKTTVFPNPAVDNVTILSSHVLSKVFLFDILGCEVWHGLISEEGKIDFNVSTIPNGIYTLSLDYKGSKVLVDKIVVLK